MLDLTSREWPEDFPAPVDFVDLPFRERLCRRFMIPTLPTTLKTFDPELRSGREDSESGGDIER